MKLRWSQINWTEAEEQVSRLQIRIVKATLEQKWRLVKRLQYLMTSEKKVPVPGKKVHGIWCLSPAKKYKLYKSSINKSIHFVQRNLSSSTKKSAW